MGQRRCARGAGATFSGAILSACQAPASHAAVADGPDADWNQKRDAFRRVRLQLPVCLCGCLCLCACMHPSIHTYTCRYEPKFQTEMVEKEEKESGSWGMRSSDYFAMGSGNSDTGQLDFVKTYVRVKMCVSVHIYKVIYMHACMHAYIQTCLPACLHTHTYTGSYVLGQAQMTTSSGSLSSSAKGPYNYGPGAGVCLCVWEGWQALTMTFVC